MAMFCRPFERRPGPINQPVPTTQTAIPHLLPEIAKAKCSRLAQGREVGEVSGPPGGSECLPRLVLEHLELRSGGSPSMVEITEEPAVFPIDATREPNVHETTQLRLELITQALFHRFTHVGIVSAQTIRLMLTRRPVPHRGPG